MRQAEILDIIEDLLAASEHPDHVKIDRYGADERPGGQWPSGVRVSYQSGATASLWGAVPASGIQSVQVPPMPAPRRGRPGRLLVLAHRLLDAARPAPFAAWELCSYPDVDMTPAALRIRCADGTIAVLRCTAASGAGGHNAEPEVDPYPDYRIPQGVQWHPRASVPTAARS